MTSIDDIKIVKALDRFIDNTLNKVNAVNKPFKAIQRTDEYKAFQDMFEQGLKDQIKWVTDELPNVLDSAGTTEKQPITLDQKQKILGQLTRDMPGLSSYVSEQKVFQDIKQFFEWSAVQQYKRWGYKAKADGTLTFTLSNTQYVNQLKNQAAYLLNQSSLDSTTIDEIISIIEQGTLDGLSNDEIASTLSDQFDGINASRADMIARTESANSMGMANYATAKENGAQTHEWIAAGGGTDEICGGNADAGPIPIDEAFPSGDMSEPGHPNCECYTQAGEINLDSIDIWGGS